MNAYKHILVGIDGSPQAEAALAKAAAIARSNGARLIIVHIMEEIKSYRAVAFDDGTQIRVQDQAQELVNNCAKRCVESGCKDVVCIVEKGNPKALLALDIPQREKVDLIVTGATGLNAFERLMIGSCAGYIIEHAKADVLVVRN